MAVTGERRRLPLTVEVAAFRIGREAVANAVRHAQARTITTEIDYGARELTVRIVDDGRGFRQSDGDAARRNGHWGLVGMHERARRAGGKCDVGAASGGGTAVVAVLPWRRRAEKTIVWSIVPPLSPRRLLHMKNLGSDQTPDGGGESRGVGSIRVMTADDHPIFRGGLAALLAAYPDIELVAEAADGAQALELFRAYRPDVTLMDLSMPVMGGAESIALIRAEFPDARIIALTTYEGDGDIHRALKAGARGYLLKDVVSNQVADAIRAVHRGGKVSACRGGSAAGGVARPASSSPARELEVLNEIAKGKSNRDIASAIGRTEATVKVHVVHILEKLGANNPDRGSDARALRRGIIHPRLTFEPLRRPTDDSVVASIKGRSRLAVVFDDEKISTSVNGGRSGWIRSLSMFTSEHACSLAATTRPSSTTRVVMLPSSPKRRGRLALEPARDFRRFSTSSSPKSNSA